MLTKTFPLKDAQFEKVALEEDTLAAINRFALEPLSKDDVYIRRMKLANNQLDRDFERFSDEVLEHFAQTLPGKSFLVGHQHATAPIGRFFEAKVVSDGSGLGDLIASFYTVKTEENEHLRRQIDGGVYSYVSIGFRAEKLVCDICGKDMKTTGCSHYPGKSYNGATATGTWSGKAEAMEGSLVYLGAQHGAQFVKSPEPPAPSPKHADAKADKDIPWSWDWAKDADAIIENLGWEGLERACAYTDPEADRETKVAYKLPHAKMIDGRLTLLFKGVVAAMAALKGARGGVDIPESQKRAVYEHLARHYREFGEEPPEFKSLQPDSQTHTLTDSHAKADISTLESKVSLLEKLLEQRERRIDDLEELAEEGKLLRSDLIAQIISKAELVGMTSLFDSEMLSNFSARRLKALLDDLNRKFDEKYPPQGTSQASTLKPQAPKQDYSPYKLSS